MSTHRNGEANDHYEGRIELTLAWGEQTIYRFVGPEWLAQALDRIAVQQCVQEVARLADVDPAVRYAIAMRALGTGEGLQAVRYVDDIELRALLNPVTVPMPFEFAAAFKALTMKTHNILSDDELSPNVLVLQPDSHVLVLADENCYTQALRITTDISRRSHEIQIFELVDKPHYVHARAAVDLADLDTAVQLAFDAWGTR